METFLFKIKLVTNLHAGSGDAGFGIVDKLVQRDAATGLPTIYGSGIKGALKEYCRKRGTLINEIFGDEDNGAGGAQPGMVNFLSADLLALPIPQNQSPFFTLVCDNGHLGALNVKYRLLKPTFAIPNTSYTTNQEAFKQAVENLPVIARNHLENGISQNLWYEEVVPHQSEFIVAMQCGSDPNNTSITDFINTIEGELIQVGGNATVGYGLCLFTQFP